MILDKLPHYSDRATEAMSLSVSTQCKPKTSPPLGMDCIWEFAKIRSTFWGPPILGNYNIGLYRESGEEHAGYCLGFFGLRDYYPINGESNAKEHGKQHGNRGCITGYRE